MDLDRLKIPEQSGNRGGGWKTVVLCLVFLGLGYGAARLADRYRPVPVTKVKTVVVGPTAAGKTKTFQAGGWIEVASPKYPILISSRISERIAAIHVKEGDGVEPGRELVRLDDEQRRTRLAVEEKRLATARKELELLQAGFRREEVQAAEARLREAAEQLRYAKASYERLKNLDRDVLPVEDLDRALAAYKSAEARHAQTVAELAKVNAGQRAEDIAIAQARVAEAQAGIDVAKLELTFCAISAPADGPRLRVLRVLRRVGEWMNQDKPTVILELYDPKEMQARVDVTQANVRYVRVGDPVRLTIEARPGQEYSGKVLRIEPLAELAKNTLTVRIQLEAPDEHLHPEMVTQAQFRSEEPGDGPAPLVLPKAALRQEPSGAGSYVFVAQNGLACRRAVTVAGMQGEAVRISGGLDSGARVIVGGPETLEDGMKIEEP
jgi:HlyD family secretion protein